MFVRLLIIILILVFPKTSDAQLEELLGLSGLASGIQQSNTNESDSNDVDDQSNDKKDDASKIIDPARFLAEDYGFVGDENFDGKQMDKKFLLPLEYFGYSFFVNAPSTFPLSDDLSVSDSYILGVGDKLQVILYGTRNQKFSVNVSRDGDIYFPELGPVPLASLTFGEAKKLINDLVEKNILGTEVKVTLSDIRSIDIFVLGEAFSPGIYTISSLSTLTNAIMSSGGIKKSGSLRKIQLKRNGDVIKEFDLYDLLLNGDTSNDSRLLPGDVVFIPPIGKTVAVYGEVNRPAIYELNDNENLADLLKYTGNLKPKANINTIEIISVDDENNAYKIRQANIKANNLNNAQLASGDVVRVYSVNDEMKNAVLLKGHTKNSGFFPLSSNKYRISDFIKSQDDLLSRAQTEYVLIKRKDNTNGNFKFLQVDLEDVFSNPESEENISLMEKDEIIFLPKLLFPEEIKTSLIQDEYEMLGNQTTLVDSEWSSLTALRKSLMEEELDVPQKDSMEMFAGSPITDPRRSPDIRRYYEYSLHNYCFIPQSFAIRIIESTGFQTNQAIPIDQLREINDPIRFQALMMEIESSMLQKEANMEYLEENNISSELTKLCRDQIIEPLLSMIEQQKTDDNSKKTAFIYGNVHFAGEYPLTESMTLSDIIKASGGLKEATFNNEIELTRRDVLGKTATFTNRLASSQNKNDMQIMLSPGDTITVKQIKKENQLVEVTGEVYFAGIYPITEYQTLGELIKRSGGLTEFASPNGTVFQRDSLKDSEIRRFSEAQEELKRKILLSSTSAGLGQNSLEASGIEQLTTMVTSSQLSEKDAMGRLVVDLEGILNGTVPDVVLEDGDKIHIPRLQQAVTVIGEVFSPNTHLFSEKLSLDDYLGKSGGLNNFADKDNIYLIKSNGSIISPSNLNSSFFRAQGQGQLEPGDTIVVPLQVTPFSGIRATTEITQIIYQMALAAAALNSFSN